VILNGIFNYDKLLLINSI